ncbi:hypothetical protein ACOYR1_02505 [Thalassotalea piscium]
MEVNDEIKWFLIDLGDALLATNTLYELQDELTVIYQQADENFQMQAFYLHESGELHCKVKVYLSETFQQIAKLPNATESEMPPFTKLSFLAGYQTS